MPDVTTVLVVDDHFLFAQAIGAAITGTAGLELAGLAVTGPQAIAMVRSGRPDVVLLDHHLPGTTSDQLIPQLHAQAPATRVIVITSDLAEATKVAAIRAGAAGFLTKDRAVEEVVDAVLGGDTVVLRDEAIARGAGAEQLADPSIALPQREPVAAPPPLIEVGSAGEGHLVVRAEGVGSLVDLARLERIVGSVASVERVHATRLSDGSASLIATLRAGHSSTDVSRDLAPLLVSAWKVSEVAAKGGDAPPHADPGWSSDPADIRAAMADALAGTAPRPAAETVRHHERVAVSRRPRGEPPRPAVGVVASQLPPVSPVGPFADTRRPAILAAAAALALALGATAALQLTTPLPLLFAVLVVALAAWSWRGDERALQLLLVVALIVFVERASAPLLLDRADGFSLAAHAGPAALGLALAGLCAAALRAARSDRP